MSNILSARVKFVGPSVGEFIDEGILVFFGLDAPKELMDVSVIWDFKEYSQPLEVGDVFYINDNSYEILGIGELANENLEAIGHLVIRFNGNLTPLLPGDVIVENKSIPTIKKGMTIQVERN